MNNRPEWWDRDHLTRAWWEHHERYPAVGRWLRDTALSRVRRARRVQGTAPPYLGIGDLWEDLRWHTQVDEAYGNLDNNHRALYVRWLTETVPELADAFVTRTRTTRDQRPVLSHLAPRVGHWIVSKNAQHVVAQVGEVGGHPTAEAKTLCGIWVSRHFDVEEDSCERCLGIMRRLVREA